MSAFYDIVHGINNTAQKSFFIVNCFEAFFICRILLNALIPMSSVALQQSSFQIYFGRFVRIIGLYKICKHFYLPNFKNFRDFWGLVTLSIYGTRRLL